MTADPKKLYINLLKHCLLDNIYKNQMRIDGIPKSVTENDVENGLYWPDRAHTMVGLKRLENVQFCVEDTIKNNIPGDLIETGVWRGGCTIFMRGILKAYNITDKKVFVADSFEGLPKPDIKYPFDVIQDYKFHTFPALSVSDVEVKNNFKAYELLDDNVVFVKGFFENSLKTANINKLSVLRLDGDMYSSTIQVLEQLYDKLSVGGYIIIDDYCIPNCRAALEYFRAINKITDPIIPIDPAGVYWKKT